MMRWLESLIVWLVFAVFVLGMLALVSAHAENGQASMYSSHESFSRTASGERMNDSALTAAHRTLPFGTRVKVTNTHNGLSVVVRINDRGPARYLRKRVIDLSPAAARALCFSGLAPVILEIVR